MYYESADGNTALAGTSFPFQYLIFESEKKDRLTHKVNDRHFYSRCSGTTVGSQRILIQVFPSDLSIFLLHEYNKHFTGTIAIRTNHKKTKKWKSTKRQSQARHLKILPPPLQSPLKLKMMDGSQSQKDEKRNNC
jgi:hypothetical protein